jgi:GNAT superfamily N-acetyltransferase
MCQKCTIRFAKKRDLPRSIELCELHALFEQCAFDSKGKSEALSTQLFCDDPRVFCLITEQSDTLIGYATHMKQYATWDAAFYMYMDCLFLTEATRGKGVGEELINRIKLEAKTSNCSHIQWQTPDLLKARKSNEFKWWIIAVPWWQQLKTKCILKPSLLIQVNGLLGCTLFEPPQLKELAPKKS